MIYVVAAKQNQKFPFHFLSAPPTPPPENLKKEGKFLVLYRDRRGGTRRISPFPVQNRFEQSRVIQHRSFKADTIREHPRIPKTLPGYPQKILRDQFPPCLWPAWRGRSRGGPWPRGS